MTQEIVSILRPPKALGRELSCGLSRGHSSENKLSETAINPAGSFDFVHLYPIFGFATFE